jgi:hypothetical protein
MSPFSGGYFEHREWAIRRIMEQHHILRPLFEYEAHYTNSAGYWMSFSSAAIALRGEALKLGGTTGVDEAEMFDVLAMMAERYGLRVVGLRVEFYKKSAKNAMHARLVMPVLDGQNDTPATDDLDDVMENLDMHMTTQLMKAAASLHATDAVKRSGTAEPPPSSHEIPKASAMARGATASRVVEDVRGVGVLVPSRSVRDSGATSIHFSSGEAMNRFLRPWRTTRLGARIFGLGARKAYTKM